jgi:outer membrane immunogenic protein
MAEGVRAMINVKMLAIAALTAILPAGAYAADAIELTISSGAAVPVYDDGGFDWNGFYAGVYGIGQYSTLNGGQYGAGVNLGVNAQFDFFLIGAEVALHGLTNGTVNTAYGEVVGRAGLTITDDVLLYAAAGYGLDLSGGQSDALLGGGLEFAATDDITIRAQYLHGFPVTGGNPKDQFTVGANFHF